MVLKKGLAVFGVCIGSSAENPFFALEVSPVSSWMTDSNSRVFVVLNSPFAEEVDSFKVDCCKDRKENVTIKQHEPTVHLITNRRHESKR